MAKRRNPKPKHVTELVAVEQPAPSVDASAPVAALEDQPPSPTEAVSELAAMGEAPALAAEPSSAEPVAVAEPGDVATPLATAEQPIEAAAIAIDAISLAAEP